jgi:SAM-dependent methyltransferase
MPGSDPPTHRFYNDLARWWPLISPVEEYAGEAAEFGRWLATAERGTVDVLELGSGGGHNAHHLKRQFSLTLSDLSDGMLAVSRARNPECAHVPGDMRTLRLDRDFDAVFIHDAIEYMTTEADLAAAITTAYVHCRPGGLALLVPDHVAETFAPATDWGGTDGEDGRGVRFMDWSFDPDPADALVRTEYAFVFREPDGAVWHAAETHVLGLFPTSTWLRLIEAAGFRAEAVTEQTDEDRDARVMFVGRRPG